MSKECSKCRQTKPLDEFPWRDKSNGKKHSRCLACKKIESRSHYLNNKSRYKDQQKVWLEKKREISNLLYCMYLTENPCKDCNESNILVLEPDHVRGEKKLDISDMLKRGYIWKDILVELEKCEIVCANCHRIRTYSRKSNFRNKFLESVEEVRAI